MPGKKTRSIQGGVKGRRMYEALKRRGLSKTSAAKITNAKMPPGKSKGGKKGKR